MDMSVIKHWGQSAHHAVPVLLQDHRPVTADAISERCADLSADLRRAGARRLIVPTDRADHVVIGLLACQLADCDLALHRGPAIAEGTLEAMQVDVMLTPDLKPALTGVRGAVRQGKSKIILMTSGTTGVPKAASHDVERLAGLVPGGSRGIVRWLLTYHPASFAGFQVILTALSGGTPLAALSNPDVVALAKLAVEFQPTSISGTPTFWRAFLLAIAGSEDAIPLRHATLGGEAVDQATLDLIRGRFPASRVTHIYASTEAGAAFAVKDGRAGFPVDWLGTERDGLEVRVVDNVLQLRSPRRMERYVSGHDSPLRDDGWLDTGDLVTIDHDRVLFSGRKDSIINVGGQKVRPEEVETLILRLPGVVDAHVKGIPNPITGQLVGADIVAAPDIDETLIRQAVKALGKSLPAYAVPRVVRIVSELPVTLSGKKRRT